MKFFGFIFLLLLCEVNADRPPLSFINLIPSLMTNIRYIKENMIDSNLVFNTTVPFIQIDSTFGVNQSNCTRDLQTLSNDFLSRKIWALKTLDAWGKLPSGLMHGNIFWIGSVYECQHHLRGFNNTIIAQPFKTHTCTIGNGISTTIRPVYGICIPQSCNVNDIVDFVNRRIIKIPSIKNLINLTNDSVHCVDYRRLDTSALSTIVLISVIVFLILLATGLHVMYGNKPNMKKNDLTPAPATETLLSRTIITTDNPSSSDHRTDEYNQSTSPDEVAPLVTTSDGRLDSVAQNLINCCSLINNYQILKYNSYPQKLACLNGIRVLSLCWIVLGHTIIFAAYYSGNGLLTSFTYFISKVETERFSLVKFILNHYVHHYLRYTILYGIILLIYINLSPYLGQGGPMYPMDGIESASCRQTWWRNLLYINNFFELQHSCMPVTWFLAVNMQFHWIAPLFLLIVSWKWLFGMLVSVALIIVDLVTTAVIVSNNNYDYGLLSDFYSDRSNLSSTTNGYLQNVYIKPWCRVAPYALGLSIGYIIYEVYQRSNSLSWDNLIPRPRVFSQHHYKKQIVIWAFALTTLAFCIFATYGDYSGHPLTRGNRIAFLTLSRLQWSAGLCMIIGACFSGHGGVANRLLSRPCFYKLSKLTYGAYLWHSLVIFVNYLGREQPTHYTIANIFFNFTCYTILSYFLSFLTFLLIELPLIQLLKLCFNRPAKPQ
ncbi:unnamed protein product [Adineta ricciae]|uniref:Nose resistant-to-fluoxetine protein N-terminal domain-containing protein n=1 Tax=Adineta ricciae TaxID=249248 RepID=A0A813RJW0_ADIRI|nr:unnamed protein product [Adineta ricciae]